MMQYFLPLVIVFLIGALGVLLINFFIMHSKGDGVEIIIDGNTSGENLEQLIIAAKTVAEKYLVGARIYIRGGNEFEVNLLCRRYNIERI